MAFDQRDTAGELADLGEKLTRPLIDDRRHAAKAVALGDRDMAGQDDEHAGSDLAGLEQRLARLVAPEFAEPAHPRDFVRRQFRKCLLIARKRKRRSTAICAISGRGIARHRYLTPFARQNRRAADEHVPGHSARGQSFRPGRRKQLFARFLIEFVM